VQLKLVEQCKLNNRKAQQKLYKQYCEGMFCVAMRFLKNSHDAEDAVQESFIKAFQRINQFKADVTFGAWLKRIVINTCIDFLKLKKQDTIQLDENYLDLVDDTDWEVSETIALDKVISAIEALPEKYRYVVQLFLVEGFDHTEISEVLKISTTASRTRLLRGKKHLKTVLNEHKYEARP